MKIYYIYPFLISLINFVKCDVEREMTIEVGPGKDECFYENIKAGHSVDIEYQVVDGGQGEIDISFHMFNPAGNVIFTETKQSEGTHRLTAEEGDYRFCFDNTFSQFNTKTVFFGLLIESQEEDEDDEDYDQWDGGFEAAVSGEEVYEMKIEDIKDAMDRIRSHLTKSRFIQDQLRAYEARDRNVAENNFAKVNNWSMLNVSVMLFTGFVQVILLRSLFDEKSRFHKLWKNSARSLFS